MQRRYTVLCWTDELMTMAIYQVLYWKHIPAQVRVFRGKKPTSYSMPDQFQTEIDRMAMQEGLADTDDYLDQWQWSEKLERSGGADDIAPLILKELEAQYGQER